MERRRRGRRQMAVEKMGKNDDGGNVMDGQAGEIGPEDPSDVVTQAFWKNK